MSRRTLMANLAIGYGAVMSVYLVITVLIVGFWYYRLAHIALTITVAAGGVLLRKEHKQGSTVIGLGCAGVFLVSGFPDMMTVLSILSTFFSAIVFGSLPGQVMAASLSSAFLLAKAALVYSIPVYLIYWSLKQERAAQEREQHDDFYAERDRISERMAEERTRELQGR